MKKYENLPNIIFTGRVEDLRTCVKATEVFVSPIAYGSGIKTKILEAMAMGVPVVTNSIGAEGIDAKNGRDILISDDMEELAGMVRALLDDEKRQREIACNAQNFIKNKYQWELIFQKFRDVLQQ